MRIDALRRRAPDRALRVLAVLLGGVTSVMSAMHAQQPDSAATDSTGHPFACNSCIRVPQAGLTLMAGAAVQDTGRRKAIEYSEGYGTRLAIHRIGSYIELPMFATEYVLGSKLLTEENNGPLPRGSSLASAHSLVASGLGVLFAVNTFTGVWNLIEARHDPAGRTRRWLHSLTMLAADAGFFWTASVAGAAKRNDAAAAHHRNVAIGSMGLATASTLMMWLWKN
jgi:hypothetical protein